MRKIKWWIALPLLVFAALLAFSLTRQTDPRNTFVIPDHILICLTPVTAATIPVPSWATGRKRTITSGWHWPSGTNWSPTALKTSR